MNKAEALGNIRRNFLGPIDVTLREGEQFYGGKKVIDEHGDATFETHDFTLLEGQTILGLLHQIGVQKAELPNPNNKKNGMDMYVQQLLHTPDRPQLYTHIRNQPDDAQAAFDLQRHGLDGIHILTTVDERRLEKMHHTLPTYLDQLRGIIQEAKRRGMETRVGVEHSWNNPLEMSLPVWQMANDLKVDRISIADTVGQATHWDVEAQIHAIQTFLPHIKKECHFHNDFLWAMANSLEALANGANYIDTTLAGGIGERTGITSLSVFLAKLGQLDPKLVEKYHTEMLTLADTTVAGMLGIALPFNVITSDAAFAHKAGIHIDGIRKIGTDLYEPVSPDIVGNTRHVITGSRISGKTTAAEARAFMAVAA